MAVDVEAEDASGRRTDAVDPLRGNYKSNHSDCAMARDVHDLFSFAPSPKALPVSANFRVRILTLEDFFLGEYELIT